MKKRLNFNNKKITKKIVILIVVLLFLYYVSTTLILIDRNYFFVQKTLKNTSSIINSYFIKRKYTVKDFDKITSIKLNYVKKENDDLRRKLNLKSKNENYLIAEVTNHLIETWFNKIEISKGYKDGIKKGNPVLSPDGLVGFINKTASNSSEVDLLTNVSNSNMISVLIETEDGLIAGVLKEYDKKKGLFKVCDVMDKNIISKGSKVVLSGYGNDNYKGLYIGKVVSEEESNFGLSKTIWVKSDVNFDDILLVMIIGDEK